MGLFDKPTFEARPAPSSIAGKIDAWYGNTYKYDDDAPVLPNKGPDLPPLTSIIDKYSSKLLNPLGVAPTRPLYAPEGGDLVGRFDGQIGFASTNNNDVSSAVADAIIGNSEAIPVAKAKPTAIQDAEEYSGLMSRVVPQQGPDIAPLQGPGIAPIKTVAMLKDTNTMNMSATETSDFKQNVKQALIDKLGNSKKTAAILGAFAKESGDDYDKLEENMYYSLKNANDANFSDTKVTRALNTLPEAVKARLLADQAAGKSTGGASTSADRLAFGGALFDTAYTGGREYRGRGLIHLTHQDNYKRIGDILGIDLENNPEWASDPQYALPIAIAYLEDKGFFKLKDNEITRDKLQAIVNPNSSTEIKDDRWAKVESYMEEIKTTGWDESLQ